MLTFIRNRLHKTNNISKSTYVWNAINATASACQSTVITMVMTRTNGVNDVGVFAIAYAVANLMLYVGQYGFRRYQASDVNEKYKYGEYVGLRIITCAAMLIASVAYGIFGICFKSYGAEKFIIVIIACLVKCIQAFVDVIHGRMQQLGRLDVAAKASASRIILSTVAYVVALIVTKDLILSTAIWLAVALAVFSLTSLNASRDYGGLNVVMNISAFKGLLIEGFPLFTSYFLSMYIGNAPKYAIDACLTDDVQAYFNYVFMPAFAVRLLCNFIFNPIITEYANVWANKDVKKFIKLIKKQSLVVLGMTMAGVLVALTIGIPVLGILFGVALGDYKSTLVVVMIGGGCLAYVTFFTTVLTVIRHQASFLISYLIVALGAFLFSKCIVVNFGINGAATLYAVLMGVLGIVLAITSIYHIKKDSAGWKEDKA